MKISDAKVRKHDDNVRKNIEILNIFLLEYNLNPIY